MATRATYKFHNTELIPSATVYIHWDGHPKGAAHYIAKAIGYDGGYVQGEELTIERFIRANKDAELTQGHSSHEDTAYRYNFYSTGEMSVSKRIIERVGDEYKEQWHLMFAGAIGRFLADNFKRDNYKPCTTEDCHCWCCGKTDRWYATTDEHTGDGIIWCDFCGSETELVNSEYPFLNQPEYS